MFGGGVRREEVLGNSPALKDRELDCLTRPAPISIFPSVPFPFPTLTRRNPISPDQWNPPVTTANQP